MRDTNMRSLRWLLSLLFFAAAIPTVVLFLQAHGRLKWEALHQQRIQAEELAGRVDSGIAALIAEEDRRTFTDYRFLVVAGDPAANFVQRSPLSAYPVASPLPGIVGYFQLDPNGELTTPTLPPDGSDAGAYGIAPTEFVERTALDRRIRETLTQAAASGVASAEAVASDVIVGSLSTAERKQSVLDVARERGAVADYAAAPAASAFEPTASAKSMRRYDKLDTDYAERAVRKEQSAVLEQPSALVVASPVGARNARVQIFESEVEPMSFATLDESHLVLFRNVWRDGQRYVQGALFDRAAFIDTTIQTPFMATALAQVAGLGIRTDSTSAATLTGEPLYRTRLSAPLGNVELSFALRELPLGPGADVILWTAVLLAVVLGGGFIVLYRLGARQLELNRQQRDFVAAVSHELKTPLTSIRMYGEMLREGWADEAKKRSYYDFIFDESERLSRLIGNVLRLSRLTRGNADVELKPMTVGELMDNACSKVATTIERAGFALELDRDPAAERATVLADSDSFCQIIINLVDNALKFSVGGSRKAVVLGNRAQTNGTVAVSVRDFGPGVPQKQMRRIFELFFRGENELTRETVGTGIGLALVRELATAMKGRVDVRNVDPGAEFVVFLPVQSR